MRLQLLLLYLFFQFTLKGQVSIKMQKQSGVSMIPCTVNGLKLLFILDTGASDVSLSLTEVNFMIKNGYLSESDFIGSERYMDANGNVSEGIKVKLREIQIGEIIIKDVTATVVKNLKAPLLLGNSALKRIGKFQIDFEENVITFISHKSEKEKELSRDSSVLSSFDFKNADKLYELAESKYSSQEYEQADNLINRAISTDSTNILFYKLRAIIREQLGFVKDAIYDYDKILKKEPLNSTAISYRADLYYSLGDTTKALQELDGAIFLDSTNLYALKARGIINYEKKLYKKSISDFTKAIQYDQSQCEYFTYRGLARSKLNYHEEAISDYNRSIQLCPNNPYEYIRRANSFIEIKNYASAIVDLNQAQKLDSMVGIIYRKKGVVFFLQGELENARYNFEKAYSLDSNDSEAAIFISTINSFLEQEKWILITENNKGDKYYLRNEMVDKIGNIIKIWVKSEHKKLAVKKGNRSVESDNITLVVLIEFDCSQKRQRFLYYKKTDAKGNVVESNQRDYPEREINPPHTIAEKMISKICEQYN